MAIVHPYTKYLHIPYSLKGDSEIDGFNCWTFARYFLNKEYEIEINEFLDFDINENVIESLNNCHKAIKAHCKKQTKIKATDHPKDGDLCFMGQGSRLTHIGVLTDGGIIHCHRGSSGVGMVIFTPLYRLNDIFSKYEYFTWQR